MAYFKNENFVARYVHHYRCGCSLPAGKKWKDGWVEESSGVNVPGYVGRTHRQLDEKSNCPRFLKHVSSEPIMGNRSVKILKEDKDYGLAMLSERAKVSSVPVVAVMWCGQTKDWYFGSCRHSCNLQKVPYNITTAINEQDKDKAVESDCYGKNCAEVECVDTAFNSGRTDNNLKGCRFIARKVGKGSISACKTCRAWIKKMGGEYASCPELSFKEFV